MAFNFVRLLLLLALPIWPRAAASQNPGRPSVQLIVLSASADDLLTSLADATGRVTTNVNVGIGDGLFKPLAP